MSRRLMLRNASGGGGILPPEYQQVEWIGKENTSSGSNPFVNITTPIQSDDVITLAVLRTAGAGEAGFAGFPGLFELYYMGTKLMAWGRAVAVSVEYSDDYDLMVSKIQNYNFDSWYSGTYRTDRYFFDGRIYFVYVERAGERICNLLPCYRKSDGAIGMYDTVSQTFYTNAGTGTFTKGADV